MFWKEIDCVSNHRGRVTRQINIWTDSLSSTKPQGTNLDEILFDNKELPFKEMYSKMSSVKWRLSCLGLNVAETKWCHFDDGISKRIFVNERVRILTQASLKFVPIDNNPALG